MSIFSSIYKEIKAVRKEGLDRILLKSLPIFPIVKAHPYTVSKNEIENAYLRLSDIFGEKNVVVLGSSALCYYFDRSVGDLDFLVRPPIQSHIKSYLDELKKAGFVYDRKDFNPLPAVEIYHFYDHKNEIQKKKIEVDIFETPKEIYGINFDKIASSAVRFPIVSADKNMLVTHPDVLIHLKLKCWRDRLLSFRGDLDMDDAKKLINVIYPTLVEQHCIGVKRTARCYDPKVNLPSGAIPPINLNEMFGTHQPIRNLISLMGHIESLIRPYFLK